MVSVTGKLCLSGLEGTFFEGVAILVPLGDILIGAVRVDEGVRGFVNGVELGDEPIFLLFVGVSGRALSGMVVVSKAACTWAYTLEKSLGLRQAAA